MEPNHLDEHFGLSTGLPEAPESGRDSTIVGPADSSPGRNLVERLVARGIRFSLKGNRVRIEPWLALTPEEQATFRAHRAQVRAAVQHLTVTSGPTPSLTVPTQPKAQETQPTPSAAPPERQADAPSVTESPRPRSKST
jgi:hypothetical protein